MAYANKKIIDDLYQLVDNGYEPTFREVLEKYYSNKSRRDSNKLDTATQEKLTRLVISRVRNKFKREDPPRFFYEVGGVYKLLTSSSDSLTVVNKLVRATNGFQNACNDVIKDTSEKYPKLTTKFLYRLQASFEQINLLAGVAIHSLEEGLKENESSNK